MIMIILKKIIIMMIKMSFKKYLKQFSSFFGVGILGSGLDYVTYTLLIFTGTNYLLATVLGNIIGAINNYILNKKYTFKNKTKHLSKQIIKYVMSVLLYMFCTFALMYIAVDIIVFNKYIARFLVLGIMTILNFGINKFFVFKEKTQNL